MADKVTDKLKGLVIREEQMNSARSNHQDPDDNGMGVIDSEFEHSLDLSRMNSEPTSPEKDSNKSPTKDK